MSKAFRDWLGKNKNNFSCMDNEFVEEQLINLWNTAISDAEKKANIALVESYHEGRDSVCCEVIGSIDECYVRKITIGDDDEASNAKNN